MAETFGLSEPRQFGFDSAVQFPPHGVTAGEENDKVADLAEGYSGKIYDIRSVVRDQLVREAPTYKRFPGVMTSWDNTSRKKKAGNIFLNSSPDNYEIWLRGAIDQARHRLPKGEKIVFINAWNEWAEGAHLEPDRKYGRAYLEATRRALTGQTDWRNALDYAGQLDTLSGEVKKDLLAEIGSHLERQAMAIKHLIQIMGDNGLPKQWVTVKPGMPYWMEDVAVSEAGVSHLDQVNHYHAPGKECIGIDLAQKLYLYGWSFCSGVELDKNTPTYLILYRVGEENMSYFALISGRNERPDITQIFPKVNRASSLYSGLKLMVDMSTVKPGTYRMGVAYRGVGQVMLSYFDTEVEIA
jgi:hypothetical protein